MNYTQLLRAAINSVPVYEPGKPIEVVARELGLDPAGIAKLASNENALGSSPKALAAAHSALAEAFMYPENSAYLLRGAIARKWGVDSSNVVVTAGSNEALYLIGQLLLEPGRELVMSWPSFVTGAIVALLNGAKLVRVPVKEGSMAQDLDAILAAITPNTRIIYIPDPNNPTGTVIPQAELDRFIEALPEHVVLVYDQAYCEYRSEMPDFLKHIRAGRKVVSTHTFSKVYGLAGLRVGYAIADPEMISLINRVRPPFDVSVPALAAGLAAIDDEDWVAKCSAENTRELAKLREGLAALGLECVSGEANFVLVRFGPDSAKIFQTLQQMGYIVRPVANYGLKDYLRISVGTPDQNAGLLAAVARVLGRSSV